MKSEDSSILERALAYPYARPRDSFVFATATGETRPVDGSVPTDGLTPVLAIGSNAAPEQLRRKFSARPLGEIPVLVARVTGLDVVYAARLTSYGAIPATVCEREGTVISVHVTYLTDEQLIVMDASEALGVVYERHRVPASLVDDGTTSARDVEVYVAKGGPLLVDGAPCALSAIEATGRTLASMSEPEVLAIVAHACAMDVDAFVLRAATDRGFRSSVDATLRRGLTRAG